MNEINQMFQHLYKVISTDSFLRMESLGGEIPFFISAYDAEQELEVQDAIRMLTNKLDTNGIPVLNLNLFDLVCEIVEKEIGLTEMFAIEQTMDKGEFLDALQSVAQIHEVLLPKIADRIAQSNAKVYFLTGIAQVFPFIRSHTILNNLQSVATAAPTVTFFPGEYDGHVLKLFGKLKDDNYYRAFNIEKIEA